MEQSWMWLQNTIIPCSVQLISGLPLSNPGFHTRHAPYIAKLSEWLATQIRSFSSHYNYIKTRVFRLSEIETIYIEKNHVYNPGEFSSFSPFSFINLRKDNVSWPTQLFCISHDSKPTYYLFAGGVQANLLRSKWMFKYITLQMGLKHKRISIWKFAIQLGWEFKD